ncbi:ABC-2 type transport system ATP-binding protein [Ereboglobus sp. PH5-5]|uniref:ABC transporter ATP-binding protein n=1 Tax=Ereboglobus sp. PH5-5 TaxID=2940529 RepID=UPI0024059ACE|nr:ABC transporter ATP-binding protein [Ereboglobus sp. PH5-5]MDF9833551.1 ABC-2 type transport system ATP-binding protein [Ereboglobus sp. PH5-5]
MQPVIECDHLTHYYGDKPALRDVSWALRPGRICGLLGRNGAGKTTTINILNSFLTPRSGRCLLLGEDSHRLTPATKARIGYLIEGHVQYGFYNIHQIEKFYSQFYTNWDPKIYYHLMSKLDITPGQRIATMSCGQRSQVALGLILAQNPDLIIFDDYSMGLDPGYRRLFIEVIRDYAADGKRSILLTSHIIQDLETLIDDCIIYQRGRVLIDTETRRLRDTFRKYTFATTPAVTDIRDEPANIHLERGEKHSALHGFLDENTARAWLAAKNIPAADLRAAPLSLEDTFIALTGKY